MKRLTSYCIAASVFAASFSAVPAYADRRRESPPPPYSYWEGRKSPPPGHDFRPRTHPDSGWDNRNQPPPNWNRGSWQVRRDWLRRHGHDDDDHDAAFGIIAGTILGFALGAAVVDSQEQRESAESRLNDPGWIAYCARRYSSFDPYTGTYFGSDGLRHYCR